MSWEMKPISELCIFAIDCVNKTAPVVEYETPYKMIRTTNVKDGFIDLESVRYVEEETFLKWTRRSKPQYGDVIFTREAPVGSVGRFTSNDPNVFLGQRLFHYRPDPALLDWQYLTYILQSDAIQGWVNGIAFGATVPHIKVKDAEELKIPCPPIGTQRKIGAILSAYDDLIENNLKRIKLLEEMAQITYEEWFVRMKFPGHETAVFDEETGLPEGWEIKTIGNLLKFQKGRKVDDVSDSEFEGSQKLLLLKSLETGDYEYTSPQGHICAERNDILMLMDGARSSHCYRAEKGIVGSTMAKLAVNKKIKPYIYYFLTVYKEWLVTANTGAAIPHANKSFINKIQIKMPNENVLKNWNDFIVPLESLIWSLRDQVVHLKEARDIILPRLMTGMIDIEQVELPEAMLKRLEAQEDKMAAAV